MLLTLYAVFVFLAYGTTAAVSRLLGAGDEHGADHQAGQAMVGRALGADAHLARSAARRMIEWSVALGIVLGTATAAVHGVLPRVFTGDAEVVALCGFLLLWVAALQPVNAVAFVLSARFASDRWVVLGVRPG